MKISEYASKWNRPEDNNFAAACCENSIDELKEALQNGPDETDCREWGMAGTEWIDAIEAAIFEKKINA